MASVDTLARGLVSVPPLAIPGFWRAEGVAVIVPTGAFQVDVLLVEQDFDLNRNQVLLTCVGTSPVAVSVTSTILNGRDGFRIIVDGDQIPVPVYFQVLERVESVAVGF